MSMISRQVELAGKPSFLSSKACYLLDLIFPKLPYIYIKND
jgi:hypothetical protein